MRNRTPHPRGAHPDDAPQQASSGRDGEAERMLQSYPYGRTQEEQVPHNRQPHTPEPVQPIQLSEPPWGMSFG